MIINNFKSLMIHIFVSLISILLFFITNVLPGTPKWVTEEAYNAHKNKMTIISIVIIIIAVILYYSISRKILKKQGSTLKNILSVSVVAILGVFFWILAYIFAGSEGPGRSTLWQYYTLYNGYMVSLVENIEIKTMFILLLGTFVPSLVMSITITKN